MVEWQASAFVFLSWSVLRKSNSTTKADVLPLYFGEGIAIKINYHIGIKAARRIFCRVAL